MIAPVAKTAFSILGYIVMIPWYFAVWMSLYRLLTGKGGGIGTFPSLLFGAYYFMYECGLFVWEWIAVKTGLKTPKKRDSSTASTIRDTEFYETQTRSVSSVTLESPMIPLCPVHKDRMKLRDGPYGSFYGCRRYPTCRRTKKIPA